MKWKLTSRFLFSVIVIAILVVVLNFILITALILSYPKMSDSAMGEATSFTRDFSQEISEVNGEIIVSEAGKAALQDHHGWIQILNENGEVVYEYNTPPGLATHYSPIDAVQMYKYKEVDSDTTVFVGRTEPLPTELSYFIGFSDPTISRVVFNSDTDHLQRLLAISTLLIIIVDGLTALLVGYLFSKRITAPVASVVHDIQKLSEKNYQITPINKGVYQEVGTQIGELSKQLQASEKERKKLDQMKEDWIVNISHDLKTPLASIQGYAEMIKNTDYQFTHAEIVAFTDIIEQKALYIKDVIEDLNFSNRLRNGEVQLNQKSINLVSLLRNTVIDFLNDPKQASHDIEFDCSSEHIPYRLDELLFQRAINNLVSNAVVHNDKEVKIIVSVLQQSDHVLIKIQDFGKGVQESELEKVFERHYRGTNTGATHDGSGLGMTISHDIILAHNGDISVESDYGVGVTISIRLPLY